MEANSVPPTYVDTVVDGNGTLRFIWELLAQCRRSQLVADKSEQMARCEHGAGHARAGLRW
jgi:hypothetical protein